MAQQFRDEQRLTGHVREPAGLVRPAVVVATDADMGCARDIADMVHVVSYLGDGHRRGPMFERPGLQEAGVGYIVVLIDACCLRMRPGPRQPLGAARRDEGGHEGDESGRV